MPVDPPPGAALRARAAQVVTAVASGRQAVEQALAQPADRSKDQSLLRALVFGCLRWHHRLSWQVDQLLSRPLTRRDAQLGALLRLGLYQLQWLRIPDHAAVSATVDAAALIGKPQAKGLVNAVLRRFQRERVALDGRMQQHAEALFSHPAWLIDRLHQDWGESYASVLDENNCAPPMWLRVNARRIDPAAYLERLRAAGVAAARAARSSAAILLTEPRAAESLPGFAAGLVSVQDAAAQLAAGFMQLQPGSRVLDACAAPGNKTAHLLESCPDLNELWAIDRDAQRLGTVSDNLDRLGLSATLVHADATAVDDWWDGRAFDRILIDAPCSAIGVVRRHPDIKLLRRPDDVGRVAGTQRVLLERLWPLLKPGGRLLYATCTVLRQENSLQIDGFVAETRDARRDGPGLGGHLQIFPGQANMDGFYYACLVKQNMLRSGRAPSLQH